MVLPWQVSRSSTTYFGVAIVIAGWSILVTRLAYAASATRQACRAAIGAKSLMTSRWFSEHRVIVIVVLLAMF